MSTVATPAELLTIDVAAELRKLPAAGLEGPWQVAADLVRRALVAGASRVEVRTRGGQLEVRDDGRPPDPEALRQLGVLLDPRGAHEARHRALVELEEPSRAPWLSVAGVAPTWLRVEAGGVAGLEYAPGKRPRLTAPSGAGGTRVEWRARGCDGVTVREGLAALCRFAPVPIVVDGRELPRGFGRSLARVRLVGPPEGELALPLDADLARVWLLIDGVVGAHLTLPEAPPFAAAVEMGGLASCRESRQALREAAEPHLRGLVTRASSLAVELVPSLSRRSEAERKRVRMLLLRSVKGKGVQRRELLTARAFPATLGPDGGEERWLDLLELGAAREHWALDTALDPRRHLLPAAPVLRLDADERTRLSELLGVAFRVPQERPAERGVASRLRGLRAAVARVARRGADRLRHPLAGRPVPRAEWTAEEKRLVEGLAAHMGAPVVLLGGDGPARRRGEAWGIPRGSRLLETAARAVSRDPRWVRAAALALFESGTAVHDDTRAAGASSP